METEEILMFFKYHSLAFKYIMSPLHQIMGFSKLFERNQYYCKSGSLKREKYIARTKYLAP